MCGWCGVSQVAAKITQDILSAATDEDDAVSTHAHEH